MRCIATRYPPQGTRGVSVAQRSNRFGTVPGYFTITRAGATNRAVTVNYSITGTASSARATPPAKPEKPPNGATMI